jgi:hypothetical protein
VAESQGVNAYFNVGNGAGQYAELQAPVKTFDIDAGQPLTVIKWYCLYSPTYAQLWEFMYRMVGFPWLDGPYLMRNLPQQLTTDEVPTFTPPTGNGDGPYTPKYYATRILKCSGEKPQGYDNAALDDPMDPPGPGEIPNLDESFGKYQNYYIQVLFEQPLYNIAFRDDTTSEYDRYTVKRSNIVDAPLDINLTRQTIEWDQSDIPTNLDGDAVPCAAVGGTLASGILWNEDRRTISIMWLDLPEGAFDRDRLGKKKNTVNASPFAGYPADTLLYCFWNESLPRRHQLGMYVYDIELVFEYYQPGHNRRLNKNLVYQGIYRKPVANGACGSTGYGAEGDAFEAYEFVLLFGAI